MTRFIPLLALLTTACDNPDELPDPLDDASAGVDVMPETDGGEHRWSEEAGSLSLSETLSSSTMQTTTSGPWELRATEHSMERSAHSHYGSSDGIALKSMPDSFSLDMEESIPMSDVSEPFSGSGQQAGSLRAGATDDNAHFDAYLRYLDTQGERFGSGAMTLDVRGRQTIQALAPDGSPLPGARVSIVHPETDTLVWTARTQGDGRAPFYPALAVDGYHAAGSTPAGGWIVQVEKDGVFQSQRWRGLDSELDVTVDATSAPPAVDVCFIIDTTGSMGDEIARVKQTLLSVTEKLRADGDVDLRYGAVLYRDIGDEYVTKTHAFTTDIAGFDQALNSIQARGGGDGPESLNQGMAVAVSELSWRPDAARLAFLIADAPPHMDYQDDVTYGRSALAAIHHGIRIHTVAASGLDDRGSMVFRQVAQLSGGEFIFIEYGSVAAAAADHGVSAPVGSNNLDDIIYKRIHRELVGWGHDGDAISAR